MIYKNVIDPPQVEDAIQGVSCEKQAYLTRRVSRVLHIREASHDDVPLLSSTFDHCGIGYSVRGQWRGTGLSRELTEDIENSTGSTVST